MSIDITKKLHNPKSHSPAVYIPCWLIQIPSNLLSHAAKILYGRLSQWSTSKCTVHRTVDQLRQETGMNKSSLERTLKELRNVGLIGTYQAEAGGVNHYKFYEHPWMHEPINHHLSYQESYPQAPSNLMVPTVTSDGTPPSKVTVPPVRCDGPKVKEIKKNKKNKTRAFVSVPVFSDSQTVKSHIQQLAAQRQFEVDADIVSQGAYYAFDTNDDKSPESVVKRINIFLKMVREVRWLTPQGYNNITSQSIRDKEEQYQKTKLAEIEQDKVAYRSLAEAPGFQDMLKKLKGRANANGTRMQTNANQVRN